MAIINVYICPKVIMSQLQKGMALLISAFHKYSGKEGDKLTLSKGELKELLTNEMGDIFGNCKDQTKLDKIFKDLDANADGVVDFKEYVTLVACITMLCKRQNYQVLLKKE
ncbi:hypothetical protein QTP70_019818 [Hemibagrus guttatus]|uniref:Protein S100 n=1 Tax=Hemibagrus guttatus TaxID=175788 RepID=A0AAE0RE21_9TELE|nr:hypothetical protein QTP70_019818 [Hemibagrus guttatus]